MSFERISIAALFVTALALAVAVSWGPSAWTAIGALAAAGAATAALLTAWNTSRDISARARPYLQLAELHFKGQRAGGVILEIQVRNRGTIPARITESEWRFMHGGQAKTAKELDQALPIFPDSTDSLTLDHDLPFPYIDGLQLVAEVHYTALSSRSMKARYLIKTTYRLQPNPANTGDLVWRLQRVRGT